MRIAAPRHEDLEITHYPASRANYMLGRGGHKVTRIIIHGMAGTAVGTRAWFAAPPSKRNGVGASSAHYGVTRDGKVDVYVDEGNTAYHCKGQNLTSIGIEVESDNKSNWTYEQYETTALLIADIAFRWHFEVNENTVRPHNAFAKTSCPGVVDLNTLLRMAQQELTAMKFHVDKEKLKTKTAD